MAVTDRTPVEDRSNRVHWFSGRVHQVLDELTAGGVHVTGLAAAETAEAVLELSRAKARLEALRLALLAHADRTDLAAENGATSTGSWFAHQTRTLPGAAHRDVRLAHGLEDSFEATRAGLLSGTVTLDQAQVITEAVDALPRFVDTEDRTRAEQHLVELAGEHDSKKLKVLGKHLLHVVDSDAADAELARRLEREEADAARKTILTVVDDGNGTCHGRFKIPALHGAMLAKALNALASPKRPDAIPRDAADDDGRPVRRSTPELLGQAFCELLERYPAKTLPQAGGGLVTVLVTVHLHHLLDGLGAATLDTGGFLSPGQVRRVACHAGIIPAVLGTKSEVLDLGRKTRLHTSGQRTALALRHKTCTATGCTIPAAWCHAHHKTPWSRGGCTTVRDGTLLCRRHHAMVHHPDYVTSYLGNGETQITKTRRRRQ